MMERTKVVPVMAVAVVKVRGGALSERGRQGHEGPRWVTRTLKHARQVVRKQPAWTASGAVSPEAGHKGPREIPKIPKDLGECQT